MRSRARWVALKLLAHAVREPTATDRHRHSTWWATVAVAAEMSLGTLCIVSLGFVLGTREQF